MNNWSEIQVLEHDNEIEVSFRNHGSLSLLKSDYVTYRMKELAGKKNTRLVFDIKGVHFIGSKCFDILNLLSRIAARNNSVVVLKGAEPEVLEIIDLAREYSVFDMRVVEPAL